MVHNQGAITDGLKGEFFELEMTLDKELDRDTEEIAEGGVSSSASF
jgi:hypothetical protein